MLMYVYSTLAFWRIKFFNFSEIRINLLDFLGWNSSIYISFIYRSDARSKLTFREL